MWRAIKKGKHNNFSIPSIHFGKTSETYEVMFDESCRYYLDRVDQLDWNKLFGWSYGNHHKNSIRVGWRYNVALDIIELCIYMYINGSRKTLFNSHINIGEKYEIRIGLLEIKGKYLPTWLICKENKCTKTIYDMSEVEEHLLSFKSTWGYNLDLYFGGDEVAPHDIRIWLKKV